MIAKYLRYLRGERPGLRAGRERPTMLQSIEAILAPEIVIRTDVLLTDVSFWQETIDFVKMKAEGIKGTIIRAGQNTWKDIRFDENWSKAKGAGLPRGSYWFYDSRSAPKSQAALWRNILGGDLGELFHVADFEENYGGAYGTAAHMREFVEEFQRLSGLPNKRIGIYTGYYWWGNRVGNNQFFRAYPLWLAWYSAMVNVRVPLPWADADLYLWQYTSNGDGKRFGASSGNIDLNWWRDNEAHYNNYFGLGGTFPPPPTGGSMRYKVVWANGAAKRTLPSVNGANVGTIAYNTITDVIQDNIPDATSPSDINKRWVRLPDGNYAASNYPDGTGPKVRMVKVEDAPPPPATKPKLEIVYNAAEVDVILKPQ